jgi:hypothetical protein
MTALIPNCILRQNLKGGKDLFKRAGTGYWSLWPGIRDQVSKRSDYKAESKLQKPGGRWRGSGEKREGIQKKIQVNKKEQQRQKADLVTQKHKLGV